MEMVLQLAKLFKNKASSRARKGLVLIRRNNKVQNSVSLQLQYQKFSYAIKRILWISQKLALVLWEH